MGCATSKQRRICKHCQAPCLPINRSYSMHVVHPPQRKGDSYHVVALTSTTLGSISLDSSHHDITNRYRTIDEARGIGEIDHDRQDEEKGKQGFSMGLTEAKTWSHMIENKITKLTPRTPIMTPPGEPETINTWELMAGLEEDACSPVHFAHHFRSFSFNVSHDHDHSVVDSPKLTIQQQQNHNASVSPATNSKENNINNDNNNKKPMWLQMADDEEGDSKCPEFDPQIISIFRKSLEDLPPDHPFYLKPQPNNTEKSNIDTDINVVSKLDNKKSGSEKVIVYYTSLRGVRKTYEDCCHVRVILKSLGVRVDERDMSMHSGFKEELRELLGEGFIGWGLPRVFVGTKYIGGAEEICRMHEEGRLGEAFEGCEMASHGGIVSVGGVSCESCADIRFVPCETCSGSCKVYNDYEEYEEEHEESVDFGFQRCPDCNENGLIRCPDCCY